MQHRQVIMSVAGSDSSGGAGVQMDVRVAAAWGMHAATVVTALTAQTSAGVSAWAPTPLAILRAQLEAAASLPVRAVKIGMLGSDAVVEAVAVFLSRISLGPVVWDPVWRASSGGDLSSGSLDAWFERLAGCVDVVTPNRAELSWMTGREVTDMPSAIVAARLLLRARVEAVLVKGGHFEGDEAEDVLVTRHRTQHLCLPRIKAFHSHGTGCALSSALACGLAAGLSMGPAVAKAKRFVHGGLLGGYGIDAGEGPVNPLFWGRWNDEA